MDASQRLEIYEQVNKCEDLHTLAEIILSLADTDGQIQGRHRKFNASKMASYCIDYPRLPKNILTREFGIRQQAMYILYYSQN